eukprot:418601-Pelagomonas_calceolata.AAC.5
MAHEEAGPHREVDRGRMGEVARAWGSPEVDQGGPGGGGGAIGAEEGTGAGGFEGPPPLPGPLRKMGFAAEQQSLMQALYPKDGVAGKQTNLFTCVLFAAHICTGLQLLNTCVHAHAREHAHAVIINLHALHAQDRPGTPLLEAQAGSLPGSNILLGIMEALLILHFHSRYWRQEKGLYALLVKPMEEGLLPLTTHA